MPPRVVARQEGEVQARAGEKAELECVAHGKHFITSLICFIMIFERQSVQSKESYRKQKQDNRAWYVLRIAS